MSYKHFVSKTNKIEADSDNKRFRRAQKIFFWYNEFEFCLGKILKVKCTVEDLDLELLKQRYFISKFH